MIEDKDTAKKKLQLVRETTSQMVGGSRPEVTYKLVGEGWRYMEVPEEFAQALARLCEHVGWLAQLGSDLNGRPFTIEGYSDVEASHAHHLLNTSRVVLNNFLDCFIAQEDPEAEAV